MKRLLKHVGDISNSCNQSPNNSSKEADNKIKRCEILRKNQDYPEKKITEIG